MSSNLISYNCAYPVIKETIPRSHLGYGTNAVYSGFPPLMSDGRSVTASYQSQSVVDKYLQDKGNFSHWEYRQYLQKNGQEIMRDNFREASNDCGYYKRFIEPYSFLGQKVNTLYSNSLDSVFPIQDKSDLKQIYLSREQLQNLYIKSL